MEISGIAAAASELSQATSSSVVQLTMFKKALDIQSQSALQLIDAVAPSAARNPPHLGASIDIHV